MELMQAGRMAIFIDRSDIGADPGILGKEVQGHIIDITIIIETLRTLLRTLFRHAHLDLPMVLDLLQGRRHRYRSRKPATPAVLSKRTMF